MIDALLAATGIVVFIAVLMGLGIAALEGWGWPAGIGAAVWLILGMAFMIYQVSQEEATGPCLREKTSYQYNPATKTTMPYTHCVERGTWVDQ